MTLNVSRMHTSHNMGLSVNSCCWKLSVEYLSYFLSAIFSLKNYKYPAITPTMHRILFLCMGNICRSPAGQCVLQHLVDEAGLSDQFEIESAGTIGFHHGAPPIDVCKR
jgi:hypothetical protein